MIMVFSPRYLSRELWIFWHGEYNVIHKDALGDLDFKIMTFSQNFGSRCDPHAEYDRLRILPACRSVLHLANHPIFGHKSTKNFSST